MTTPLRVCHVCHEPITGPDDAVLVGHELGDSGPGWDIWAHRAHARQATEPDPVHVRILARILITQALRS